jgi:hypothetical protein
MGDRYDIHFQLVPTSEQAGGKLFTFGFKAAVGVRGPQKLINRWIKTFLTPKGSDPFDLTNGTGFSGLFSSNRLSRQDMIDALTLFIEDCNDQIRAGDRRNLVPDDERLQSATLSNLEELGEDGYVVYINLRNVAGLTVAVPLPIT